jgi:fumarate reductase flavoprotein subunit
MAAVTAAALVAVLALLFLGTCAGLKTGPVAAGYESGIYEGSGQGFRGPVRVAVQVEADGIAGIEILDHGDDLFPGGAAMEELLEIVLDGICIDVDVISGATESSAGFLAAVEDAWAKARAKALEKARTDFH